MSLTNSDTSIINSNPINNLIGVRARAWTCKHKGITIVDEQNWIYKCHVCWPSGGNIRVIPRTPKNEVLTQAQAPCPKISVATTSNKDSPSWHGIENVLTTELRLPQPK
jgi:hypothetical protein